MVKSKSAVKVRKRWKINPETRVEESARRYSRAKVKKDTRKAVENAEKTCPPRKRRTGA